MVWKTVELLLLLSALAIFFIYWNPLALITSSTLEYSTRLHPSLSKTLIPVVDTTFVEPLLAIDAARVRYVDILSYDWAQVDAVLTELNNLSAVTLKPRRLFWGHLELFATDTREWHSLQDVRDELRRVTRFQGWNISVGALCTVCGLLKDAVDVVRKENRKELQGLGLIKFMDATTRELRRDLIGVQGAVLRLHDCASKEERIMTSLLSNVKKMRNWHTWYPNEILSWTKSFLFGKGMQNLWSGAIEAIVEAKMGNLTAAQRQRRVKVMANLVQRFEWKVQAATGDLYLTVQELSKFKDVVEKVEDIIVYPYTGLDPKNVVVALERIWQKSKCSALTKYVCI